MLKKDSNSMSNYDERWRKRPLHVNKKVTALTKNVKGCKIITTFAGPRAKIYVYKV